MIHKHRAVRRRARAKAITRKSKIVLCHSDYWSPEYLESHKGHLAKGKVHCSCSLCQCKSTKEFGRSTNNLKGYPKQEYARIISMLSEIKDLQSA